MSKARPLVIYHADCADGFCAAWCAWLKFRDNADYVPAQYGTDPPDVVGRTAYVLDFSYKRPVMRRLLSQAHALTVLDHHKTAEAELAGLVDEFTMRPDLIANPPGSQLPLIHFDMAKSGGRLAWDHFHAGKPRPWLVDYTEDRDLWRWQLPDSRELSAAVASYPFDFRQWEDWGGFGSEGVRQRLVGEGRAILRYQSQQVANHVKNAAEVELAGQRVLAVNATTLISEIAGELAKGRPFGICWFRRQDGRHVVSLRSRDGGADVSEIARSFGGGGHRAASGFESESLPFAGVN